MKKIIVLFLLIGFILGCSRQDILKELKKDGIDLKNDAKKILSENLKDGFKTGGGFTADDAAKAIKEALVNGTTKGTGFISKLDGFYKNPEIKIPFPPEAEKIESALRKIGLDNQVDEAILSLNRAAEDASKEALNIFVNVIKGMSIADAINIVKGQENAATEYLKAKTTAQLTEKYSPVIKKSLDKVNATKYWSDIMHTYNKIPFVDKINPDLTAYVTGKAMDALFLQIQREEALIRKDPIARTSDLLKKVFGGSK